MSTSRRPGRPALAAADRRDTSTHVRLLSRDYDRAYQLAQRNRESVPEVLRRGLAQLLRHERNDDDDDD